MTIEEGTGKRRLKRLKLEAAVENAERKRQEHLTSGTAWVRFTKAELQREASVGKNYIDMLAPDDDLCGRIRSLLSDNQTKRADRAVEKTRLERNRDLEKQIILQARENQELASQLNLTRSELDRVVEILAVYERYYQANKKTRPNIALVEKIDSSK